MSEQRTRLLLPFSLLTAILAVSTASIFIRFAQRDAPSLVIAALRLTVSSLVLAPLALTSHMEELRRLSRRDLFFGMLSGVFLAVHFGTWISSLEYTSVASSVVFVSTGPLWVALLSPFFLNEPLTRTVLAGMSLAFLGGAVVGVGDTCQWEGRLTCAQFSAFVQGKSVFGNFLALVGAWAVAGYLIIGRRLRSGMSLIPYIFLVYSSAGASLLLAVFVAGQSLSGYSSMVYVWMLLLALVPQLIGHTTYNWALRYLPAALVSITTLAEPVGSATLAYIILREVPTPPTMFGGVLILTGIYLASSKKRNR